MGGILLSESLAIRIFPRRAARRTWQPVRRSQQQAPCRIGTQGRTNSLLRSVAFSASWPMFSSPSANSATAEGLGRTGRKSDSVGARGVREIASDGRDRPTARSDDLTFL